MKLLTSISYCPNDTHIFYAIYNKKIDTGKYKFIANYKDVEELNKASINHLPDITKLSFFAFFKVADKYQLLNSGSALGNNCGPLLISKYKIYPDELYDIKIAIPGKNTTAFLLMNVLFPRLINKDNFYEYLFSDIEEVVLSEECDAGLIIHETRFTYQNKKLKLISDLGTIWENRYNFPLPLGGVAVKRDLPEYIKKDIDTLIRKSVIYGFENPSKSFEFIKKYSQISDEEIISKHIELYVNNYSINLGDKGKNAVLKLYELAIESGFLEKKIKDLFVKE